MEKGYCLNAATYSEEMSKEKTLWERNKYLVRVTLLRSNTNTPSVPVVVHYIAANVKAILAVYGK